MHTIHVTFSEIAELLYKFVQLLLKGDTEQCELEFAKLPIINNDWLKCQNKEVPPSVVSTYTFLSRFLCNTKNMCLNTQLCCLSLLSIVFKHFYLLLIV